MKQKLLDKLKLLYFLLKENAMIKARSFTAAEVGSGVVPGSTYTDV